MGSFTYLLIALCAISRSLAAPTDLAPIQPDLVEREPDFVLSGPSTLARRQDSNLNYILNYTTTGDIQFSPSSNGYSVTFSSAYDFAVGTGWSTGSARNINFSGTFKPTAGSAMLSVVGWTTDPLVEYFIVEDYINYPGGGTAKGSVFSDGSNYTIYEVIRVNQPAIVGLPSVYNEYFSIRENKRSCGTVTTANHFNAWSSLGLRLGTFNYQVVATEGWGNAAGSCEQTISG